LILHGIFFLISLFIQFPISKCEYVPR
jgi:hypothetical protein